MTSLVDHAASQDHVAELPVALAAHCELLTFLQRPESAGVVEHALHAEPAVASELDIRRVEHILADRYPSQTLSLTSSASSRVSGASGTTMTNESNRVTNSSDETRPECRAGARPW